MLAPTPTINACPLKLPLRAMLPDLTRPPRPSYAGAPNFSRVRFRARLAWERGQSTVDSFWKIGLVLCQTVCGLKAAPVRKRGQRSAASKVQSCLGYAAGPWARGAERLEDVWSSPALGWGRTSRKRTKDGDKVWGHALSLTIGFHHTVGARRTTKVALAGQRNCRPARAISQHQAPPIKRSPRGS